MADIIQRPKFNQELAKIRQFSNSIPTLPKIKMFKTDGGLFNWGNYHITGKDMNEYMANVQDIFIKQNSVLTKIIKEFGDVYYTFNYLDTEYLNGILEAVNAAKLASDNAKLASEQAKDAATKAIMNEKDIQKEIEVLKKIIDEIDEIKSLKKHLSEKVSQIEIQYEDYTQKIDNLYRLLEEQQKKTKKNEEDFQEETEILKRNIDEIKSLEENLSSKVSQIEIQNEDYTQRINSLYHLSEEQQKKYQRNLFIAYILGGLGLIGSAIALFV